MSSALLVCAQEDIMKAICGILRRMSLDRIDRVNTVGEGRRRIMEREYDLLLINAPLPDEFGVEFTLDVLETRSIGVMLIVKNDMLEDIEAKTLNTATFVVPKPINARMLMQDIKYVLSAQERIQTLLRENELLARKLEDQKIIYRAKLVLMEYKQIDEDHAHRHIQKKAMDKRISPRRVAQEIIDKYS